MSKPTKATRYEHEAADYVRNSGVNVDLQRGLSTVTMAAEDGQSVFLDGDEADEFIAQVDALCKRYRSLDEDTAACALAKPFVECCMD